MELGAQTARERYEIARLACDEEFLSRVFINGRSFRHWTDQPVRRELLTQIYDLSKWCPTSYNIAPLRVTYITSPQAKAKLLRCVPNISKVDIQDAPVIAILSADLNFFNHGESVGLDAAGVAWFRRSRDVASREVLYNAKLMFGFFMIASRMLGLDIAPLWPHVWNQSQIDEAFSDGNPNWSHWRPFLVCTLGYADKSRGALAPRSPRLPFNRAAVVYDCRPPPLHSSLSTIAEDRWPMEMTPKPLEPRVVAAIREQKQLYQEKVIFRCARSYSSYYPKFYEPDFGSADLERIYDIAKLYPSAFNCTPLRYIFILSPGHGTQDPSESHPHLTEGIAIMTDQEETKRAGSSKLFEPARRAYDLVMESLTSDNRETSLSAPLLVVLAVDYGFMGKFGITNPKGDYESYIAESKAELFSEMALTNALYGVGWFISVIRAMGYDCGPMGGYDEAILNRLFLPADAESTETEWRDERT